MTGFIQFDADGRAVMVDISGRKTTERGAPAKAMPGVEVTASCRLNGRTGVEMEALTAAAVAAPTVYDMCKAVHWGIRITDVGVVHKSASKSGSFDDG